MRCSRGLAPGTLTRLAFSPDLPGCVATGTTREETEARMREAIEFHIDGLRRHGDAIPVPSAFVALPTSREG